MTPDPLHNDEAIAGVVGVVEAIATYMRGGKLPPTMVREVLMAIIEDKRDGHTMSAPGDPVPPRLKAVGDAWGLGEDPATLFTVMAALDFAKQIGQMGKAIEFAHTMAAAHTKREERGHGL